MSPTWRDGIHASRNQPIEKVVLVTLADSAYVLDERGDVFVSRVMMVSTEGIVNFLPIDSTSPVALPLRSRLWYPHATNRVLATGTSSIQVWLGA